MTLALCGASDPEESIPMKTWLLMLSTALHLIATAVDAATIVNCTGENDSPALQAALDAPRASVLVSGDCRLTQPLFIAAWDVTLRGESSATLLYDGPGYAMTIWGPQRTLVRDVAVWSNAGGVFVGGGAINTRFQAVRVNAYGGDAFTLGEGSGFWLNNQSHLNGTPGLGTRGVRVNGPWDTGVISDVVVEEHDSCLRLGGEHGAVVAFTIVNLVCDRLRGVALHIEPTGTGSVYSIQASNVLTTRGIAPVFINAARTTGYIGLVILSNWSVHAATIPAVWVDGPVGEVSTSQILYR